MIDSSKVLPVGTLLRSNSRVYTIVDVLGQGGFGITYRATAMVSVDNIKIEGQFAIKEHFVDRYCERDGTTHAVYYSRPVAIEVENSRKDFLSEARRLHDLSKGQNRHPNILCVNETFEANNTAYFVMEFLKGESLSSYIKRHGPLSDNEMRGVMEPIIDAVAFLHREYITHLDIKPSNIMLTQDKVGRVRPVLIDFGLSRHFDPVTGEPSSSIQQAGFSTGYAPVEQVEAFSHYYPGTDVYSLGATMFFALTGQNPDSAANLDDETLRRAIPAGLPASTVRAIIEAMHHFRRQRPKDAGALLSILTGGSYATKYDDDVIIPEIYEPSQNSISPSKPWLRPMPTPKPTPQTNSWSKTKRKIGLFVGIGVFVLLAILCAAWFIYDSKFKEQPEEPKVEAMMEKPVQNLNPVEESTPAPPTKPPMPTQEEESMPEPTPSPEPQKLVVGSDFVELTAGLNMKMIWVEGGKFEMGATSEQSSDEYEDEKPVRRVKLDSYYIGECEVTQSQWIKVMGTTLQQQGHKAGLTTYRGIGPNYPIYYVNWDEAQDFCRKLSRMTGRNYCLPTEAQWEYAARGGKNDGNKYSGSVSIDEVAWYRDNSYLSTHPVKYKYANGLGLYDMSGNVWEWCSDWYGDYNVHDTNNPTGLSSGTSRVLRGGCWNLSARSSRVSCRGNCVPSSRCSLYGFRVVVIP